LAAASGNWTLILSNMMGKDTAKPPPRQPGNASGPPLVPGLMGMMGMMRSGSKGGG